MSNVKISPSTINGTVNIPPSKSSVHRALICASLAKGKSEVFPIDFSNDINATIDCIKQLGAKVVIEDDKITVDGTNTFCTENCTMNCLESGSTLRFLIPIACVGAVNATFVGEGRLPQRPIGTYLELLPKFGVTLKTKGGLPLETSGKLQAGEYKIAGDISSQFITGLLFALPLLKEDSKIILTSKLESKGYVDMTINTMKMFGVNILEVENGYFIKGNQSYKPHNCTPEGDWSQVAFFMAGGAINGDVTIKGVDYKSAQGDKECVEIFKRFGAKVITDENSVRVLKSSMTGTTIDASQIPDLVPILAVVGAFAKGQTVIKNAQRLRIKESDRLKAISDGLNNIGAKVEETPDGLIITGTEQLQGGNTLGYNDHRIVMSLTIATVGCKKSVTITDKESINKSYPNFFKDFSSLGGKVWDIDTKI